MSVAAPDRVSVVALTYNWPQALDFVLRGLRRQTVLPYEVIVADDGSGAETRAVIEQHARDFPVRLAHVWQEDDGARMSRARNRGIAAARGDYIVMLDGDMVAEKHFLADHLALARRGCFVQGSRILSDAATTQRLFASGTLDLGFFSRGIDRRRHTLRNRWLRDWAATPHDRSTGVKSCNWAFWRDDLVRLNGFDEAMLGWGREDKELAARAFHSGLLRRDLRFGGQCVHLWHRTRKNLENNPNDAMLAATRAQRLTRCALGLDQHLDDSSVPPPDLRPHAAPA